MLISGYFCWLFCFCGVLPPNFSENDDGSQRCERQCQMARRSLFSLFLLSKMPRGVWNISIQKGGTQNDEVQEEVF